MMSIEMKKFVFVDKEKIEIIRLSFEEESKMIRLRLFIEGDRIGQISIYESSPSLPQRRDETDLSSLTELCLCQCH